MVMEVVVAMGSRWEVPAMACRLVVRVATTLEVDNRWVMVAVADMANREEAMAKVVASEADTRATLTKQPAMETAMEDSHKQADSKVEEEECKEIKMPPSLSVILVMLTKETSRRSSEGSA
jgi:hypothetical protein